MTGTIFPAMGSAAGVARAGALSVSMAAEDNDTAPVKRKVVSRQSGYRPAWEGPGEQTHLAGKRLQDRPSAPAATLSVSHRDHSTSSKLCIAASFLIVALCAAARGHSVVAPEGGPTGAGPSSPACHAKAPSESFSVNGRSAPPGGRGYTPQIAFGTLSPCQHRS